MANPQEVFDKNHNVVAYACNVCGDIRKKYYGDDDYDSLKESFDSANMCCTCCKCNSVCEKKFSYCNSCEFNFKLRYFGEFFSDISEAYMFEIKNIELWNAWKNSQERYNFINEKYWKSLNDENDSNR